MSRRAQQQLVEQRFANIRNNEVKKGFKWGFSDKTGWDWLDLISKLAIPLILGIATLLFGMQQASFATQQHQQDQASALDQQQATTLQTYIDNIKDLLLNHQLYTKYNFEVSELAEAQTVAALSNLNPPRKGIAIQFLRNSGLIGYLGTDGKRYPALITLSRVGAALTKADLSGTFLEDVDLISDNLASVNLTNADLSYADLTHADLSYANLTHANLSHADLLFTNLSGAIFTKANLSGAYINGSDLNNVVKYADRSGTDAHLYPYDLSGAYLPGAKLPGADLSGADFSRADLSGANLSGADLDGATLRCSGLSGIEYCADLSGADLSEAILTNVNLSGADLSEAILTNANLSGANLNGANLAIADLSGANLGCFRVGERAYCANLSGAKNLTQQQLDQVSTCKGATLPTGLKCHQNK